MTPEDRDQMSMLCKKIIEESDHARIMQLIRELNDLLERQRRHDARHLKS